MCAAHGREPPGAPGLAAEEADPAPARADPSTSRGSVVRDSRVGWHRARRLHRLDRRRSGDSMRSWRVITLVLAATRGFAQAADGPFAKGLPQTPESFPLAVWLQAPANAERYRASGINTDI